MMSIPMQIVQIPLLADNYADLIYDDGIMAVIDPSEADPALDELERQGWHLQRIIYSLLLTSSKRTFAYFAAAADCRFFS